MQKYLGLQERLIQFQKKTFYFKQMLFPWTFYSRILKKKFHGFYKNIKHTVFNINNNNEYFMSSKSAY